MLKALIDCVRNVFPFITHCTHTCIKKQRFFSRTGNKPWGDSVGIRPLVAIYAFWKLKNK